MAEEKAIHVLVYRSPSQDKADEDQRGKYVEFEVPYIDRMTILNALDFIHENHDRSLAFYKSCRIGKCTGCLVDVNGKNKLACTTLVKDGMKIGPQLKRRVVRDLVIA